MLERIEKIRKLENNFSRTSMKWSQPLSNGTIVKYADEIDYEKLEDYDLMFLFERIVKRYYSQG